MDYKIEDINLQAKLEELNLKLPSTLTFFSREYRRGKAERGLCFYR